MKNKNLNNGGFTLIELMIAVAIVALLAAVALPSYLNSIRESRRVDATSALTQAAALQERWYFTNNQYNGDIGNLMTGTDASTWVTPDGLYSLSVSTANATCGGVGTAGTCFLLTATATGAQAEDSDCNAFTLHSNGTQSAEKSDNTVNEDCWKS